MTANKLLGIVRRFVTRLVSPLAVRCERLGARHELFASVFYSVFSREFWREQRAFLAGKRAYTLSLTAPTRTMALLRRNIHRLEKGLLMRPRRVPFGLGYIEETVEAFLTAYDSGAVRVNTEEFAWAADVLADYFSAHEGVDRLNGLRETFQQVERSGQADRDCRRFVPYERDLSRPSPVEYSQLLELARRRRSVRWFSGEAVDRTLVDQAILVAAQAPSACNRQPFRIVIVQEEERLRQLAKLPFGTAGYAENIPMMAAIVGQQRHFFSERDRHLIYIDSSLFVMGLLLALETVGLSSCCINWPDIRHKDRRIAELLELDADERVVMLLAIGKPDPSGLVAWAQKKPLDELRHLIDE